MTCAAVLSAALIAASSSAPAQDEIPAQDAAESPAPPRKKIEKLEDGSYRLGEISFRSDTREIRFPARINMREGLLEYAIVTGQGKLHESLLAADVSPFDLNVVLLLLRYRPAPSLVNQLLPEEEHSDPAEEDAAAAALVVEVAPADKPSERSRLEAWVRNLAADTLASKGTWTFTGSTVLHGQFNAEVDGSILALYLDPRALINNPRDGNLNDEVWVGSDTVPEVGADVIVTIRPAEPEPPETPPENGGDEAGSTSAPDPR